MATKFDELCSKLSEIFQIDKPELDFGIYRIINMRAKEIKDFLSGPLKAKTQAALGANTQAEIEAIRAELNEKIQHAESCGANPEDLPVIRDLKAKLVAAQADEASRENLVYTHLLTFFSRYYEEGDFISKRRYKGDVYAIPYSGEEVKLHWANADQYYTKSGENFTNYDFRLSDGKKIHFKLLSATTAKDNVKDTTDKRFFALWSKADADALNAIDEEADSDEDTSETPRAPECPIEEKNDELYIYFKYTKFPEKVTQKDLLGTAEKTILEQLTEKSLLQKYNVAASAPSEKDPRRTILQRELTRYTEKNSSDYFIHRDLKGFLSRELDFYIKNEMMNLDDVQNAEAFVHIEKNLRVIQTVRIIATQLIEFMAEIENFQKRLWLKKKFVISCDYCLTLDRVPAELHEQIFANEAQLAEWEKLGLPTETIAETSSGSDTPEAAAEVQGTLPLGTPDDEPSPIDARMVDTQFFDADFKAKLLGLIDDIDEQCDGVIIHSENFQALNLLQERYKGQVKCIYIDPPYNTDATPILYKNGYKDSTWLTMMEARFLTGKHFLKKEGYHSVAIDDVELHPLALLISQTFPENDLFQVMVNHYPGSGTGRTNVSKTHEYNLFSLRTGVDLLRGKEKPAGERVRGFCRSGTGDNNYRRGRPNSFYAVIVDEESHVIKGVEPPPEANCENYPKGKTDDGFLRVYPLGADGAERCWSLGFESAKKAIEDGMLICSEQNSISRLYHDVSSRSLLPSMWIDKKYSASSNGTNLLTNLLGKSGLFSFPKSLYTVIDAINAGVFDDTSALILDYFGGSGTTAHATIALNREDGGKRKYILVEMGEHFNTVLKPRIEKVVYSPDWKGGKPESSDKGISHCFKYLRLESYEDALDNIALENGNPAGLFNEDYLLKYMMRNDSRNSFLSTDDFKHPFDYTLKVAVDSAGVSEPRKVDLVETFNYLIGLHVAGIDMKLDKGYVLVEGKTPKGESTLVVWRDLEKINNEALNELLERKNINAADSEYDVIYINGDHAVQNLTLGTDGERKDLKVKQIETTFIEKMFTEAN